MPFIRFAILVFALALSLPIVSAQEVPPPQPLPQRIRVGANVAAASLVHQAIPVYPPIAKTAHIQGIVVLHAIIGRDGNVVNLEYVSGPPLLMRAAMDAVRQWQYRPTLLDGQPVEVDTTISVIFELGGNKTVGTPGGDQPPSPPAVPPTPQSLPRTPPAEAEATGPPYPDTIEGMRAQMQTVIEAWRSTYKQDFFANLHGFAVSDPKQWLTDTFGADKVAALLPQYETSFAKFEAHITYVSSFWEKSSTSYLLVEPSPLPKPKEGDENFSPPKPVIPLEIENFRFMVKTGQEDPGDWVFSFVYLGGAFRIVGGTYPFWDENLQAQNMRGGSVRLAKLIHYVAPEYPLAAKKNHIEGIVNLRVVIGKDGSVKDLSVIDGDPDLARAAINAVRQWRYEPTLLDGEPIEVNTTIAVIFDPNR